MRAYLLALFAMNLVDLGDSVVVPVELWMVVTDVKATGFFPQEAT